MIVCNVYLPTRGIEGFDWSKDWPHPLSFEPALGVDVRLSVSVGCRYVSCVCLSFVSLMCVPYVFLSCVSLMCVSHVYVSCVSLMCLTRGDVFMFHVCVSCLSLIWVSLVCVSRLFCHLCV